MSRYNKNNIHNNVSFICAHCCCTVTPPEFGSEHRIIVKLTLVWEINSNVLLKLIAVYGEGA